MKIREIIAGVDAALRAHRDMLRGMEDFEGDVGLDDYDHARHMLLLDLVYNHVVPAIGTLCDYLLFCEALYEHYSDPTDDEMVFLDQFRQVILGVDADPFVRPWCEWSLPCSVISVSSGGLEWFSGMKNIYGKHTHRENDLSNIALFFSLPLRPDMQNWLANNVGSILASGYAEK